MHRNLDTNTQIVILAGGKGTRLSAINKGLPKSLTPLLEVPIIEHQIRFCRSQGFVNFLLILAYESQKIIEHFESHPIEGIEIKYFKETSPKGTGGAICASLSLLEKYFFVIYSDTYFTINLSDYIQTFNSKLNDNTQIHGMILVHPNNHPYDSDIVELNSKDELIAIHGYPHKKQNLRNLVNAAFYLIKKDLIIGIKDNFKEESIFDIAKDIFPVAVKKGFKIFGYSSSEYIKDMGTPTRLEKLEKIIKKGKLRNLSPNISREVVFIDRDGCINEEKGRITDKKNLKLIDGAGEAIRNFNNSALPVFCITNQPVIARGDINHDELNAIHSKLDFLLGKEKAFIDSIYYCPHHPDKGFKGEVLKYKINCNCRKPEAGLLLLAAKEHNINFGKSWLIGDMTTDIAAGKKLGLRTILLKTGYGGTDLKENVSPDYIFNDLKKASEWITINHEKVRESIIKNIAQLKEHKIILVSGLNHNGKSNYSRVIKEILEGMGYCCNLINSYKWNNQKLCDSSNKNLFIDYDLKAIKLFIDNYINNKFPIYYQDSLRIRKDKYIKNINETIFQNSIIIIEGPPIAKLFKTYQNCSLKILLTKDIEKRKTSLRSQKEYLMSLYQQNVNLLKEIEINDKIISEKYLKYTDIEIKVDC